MIDLPAAFARDAQTRLAAQTVFDHPLAVEAGAGTGKTAILVARVVIWSLGPGWHNAATALALEAKRFGRKDDDDPQRIAARVLDGVVAITFTEAAAAEMAARVGGLLADLAALRPCPTLADQALAPIALRDRQQRAQALLGALDHLMVSTIHAFCRRILATYPLAADIHPAFSVDADGSALERVVEEIVTTLLREGLRDASDGRLVALAGRGRGGEQISTALRQLINAGIDASALLVDPFPREVLTGLRDELVAGLDALCAAGLNSLRGVSASSTTTLAVLAAIDDTQVIMGALATGDKASFTALCEALRGIWKAKQAKRLQEWAGGEFTGSERRLLGDSVVEFSPVCKVAMHVIHRLVSFDPVMLDLARLTLAPLLERIQHGLRSVGAVSFNALLVQAHRILATQESVALHERRRIDQLLVDEFQDTDHCQCEILRLLAFAGQRSERPGLFVVGDPKQSIYGWRNADLAAYEAFLAELCSQGGEVLPLDVNFRSAPVILNEVERIIAPSMQAKPGLQPAFRTLLPCSENQDDPGFAIAGRAPVEHWVSWTEKPEQGEARSGTKAADATELEALAIALDIRTLHAEHGVAWCEFGVLLRSFGDVDDYLQAMREAGVPYLVERDRSYYRRQEIIEAVALVRTVLDPADHLALLTWLRSANVGVPDAAWLPLWQRGFPDLMTSLVSTDGKLLRQLVEVMDSAVQEVPKDVPGIDRIAGWELSLRQAVQDIARLRTSRANDQAAVFVEKLRSLTLVEASNSARLLGEYRLANLERFFRQLGRMIETAASDANAVLRFLRRALARDLDAEEASPRLVAADAVRVMTIHKAKGLDFAHVYLVQSQRRSRLDQRDQRIAEEVDGRWEYELFDAPTPGWQGVKDRRDAVRSGELVRTLYVALTRAKRRLVVLGNWPVQPKASGNPSRSHLDLIATHRSPDRTLDELYQAAASSSSTFADDVGARWVFPMLLPLADGPLQTLRIESAIDLGEVARQSDVLKTRRTEALLRMNKPFSGPVSQIVHEALRARLADRDGDDIPPTGASADPTASDLSRERAMAVGRLIHRSLEVLDIKEDAAAAMEQQIEALPSYAHALVQGEQRKHAEATAAEMLTRMALGPLQQRWQSIRSHIIARELPVLLPGGEDGPVGVVVGAIDLVYQDPISGEIVVADYKTDEVTSVEEAKARATAYAKQLHAYQQAIQQSLGLAQPPRGELWFIAIGCVVPV